MMKSMTARISPRVALLALFVGGCATGTPLPPWSPGLADDARRSAEADPEIGGSERWLLESGLAHARPGTEEYDPEIAADRFIALLERHPDTRHRPLVSYLLPLLTEEARQRREMERLAGDLERQRQHVTVLQARIDGLNQLLDNLEDRDESYQETIAALQASLESRTRQLREMEEKLDALMRVDLEPRR